MCVCTPEDGGIPVESLLIVVGGRNESTVLGVFLPLPMTTTVSWRADGFDEGKSPIPLCGCSSQRSRSWQRERMRERPESLGTGLQAHVTAHLVGRFRQGSQVCLLLSDSPSKATSGTEKEVGVFFIRPISKRHFAYCDSSGAKHTHRLGLLLLSSTPSICARLIDLQDWKVG